MVCTSQLLVFRLHREVMEVAECTLELPVVTVLLSSVQLRTYESNNAGPIWKTQLFRAHYWHLDQMPRQSILLSVTLCHSEGC